MVEKLLSNVNRHLTDEASQSTMTRRLHNCLMQNDTGIFLHLSFHRLLFPSPLSGGDFFDLYTFLRTILMITLLIYVINHPDLSSLNSTIC
ncbi:hypothetical protein BD408DRAFT_104221 [Parasitella parasitica]|nr:hypothetical protein BD408DRAFT_104221 [Parasitella parasitica]